MRGARGREGCNGDSNSRSAETMEGQIFTRFVPLVLQPDRQRRVSSGEDAAIHAIRWLYGGKLLIAVVSLVLHGSAVFPSVGDR